MPKKNKKTLFAISAIKFQREFCSIFDELSSLEQNQYAENWVVFGDAQYCTRCGRYRKSKDFTANKTLCLDCLTEAKKRIKEYYRKNPEKYSEKLKKDNARNKKNPGIKLYQKKYRESKKIQC